MMGCRDGFETRLSHVKIIKNDSKIFWEEMNFAIMQKWPGVDCQGTMI